MVKWSIFLAFLIAFLLVYYRKKKNEAIKEYHIKLKKIIDEESKHIDDYLKKSGDI